MLFIHGHETVKVHGHETVKVPLGATPTTAQGNRCYRASMYNQVVV